MEKEYAPSAKERKQMNVKSVKAPVAKEIKQENKSSETKMQNEEIQEVKTEEKKEEIKVTKKEVSKKDEAISNGLSLSASKRHCMYICSFIKGKSIDEAISDLILVTKLKKIVPMKGEIPHRKGKGMMSGRYPVNASKLFINLLKSLKGNVIVNGMDLDKTRIYYASASWASRPARAGGVRFKRTNVILKAKEILSGRKNK